MARSVSLCMIVKNEEAHLPACLESASDLVQEVIVVDTGSTDRTKELAAGMGAKVFDFEWIDDFAVARNESIRHATSEWIFWLDADDRLDEVNRARLRTLVVALGDENVGYLMTYEHRNTAATRTSLFRNHPEIRWQYRVHEQILPAVERLGGSGVPTDIVIHTVGYADPAGVRGKMERNLRLLRLENADRPGNSLTEWNLGRTTLGLDLVEEAASWFDQCLRRVGAGRPFYLAWAYAQLAEALCRLRRFPDALAVCSEGRSKVPEDTPLLLAEGVVLAELGDLREAEVRLREVTRREPGNPLARRWLARVQPMGQFQVGR